ncbi:MAG: hypothetical protein INR73_08525 [Williamsia sp.]|nr:hypothetical protein [Williamsia sp.]
MPRKHKIFYALAGLHLLMVGLFASHMGEWGRDAPLLKAASKIGDYTGSNNIFSFFAPALSDQPYVVYAVKDTSGHEQLIDLKGSSPDFTNRINNVYGYLTLPEGRDVFAASLARFVSRQYPGADKIRVAMVVQQIPDMSSYRKGERCRWRFWFHRDFKTSNLQTAQHAP